MTTWVKDPEITKGGDVGGDYQMTQSWSARFRREDDPCRIITIYAYGELPESRWAPFDAWRENEPEKLVVTVQVEMLVCTDAKDPGGTETWSDAWYHTAWLGSAKHFSSSEAETLAKDLVSGMRADHELLTGEFAWDGLATWERT